MILLATLSACGSERLGDVRMSPTVPEARPYQVVTLEYRGPRRLLSLDPSTDHAVKGLTAVLDRRTRDGWRPVYTLISSVWGERHPVACPNALGEGLGPGVAVPLGVQEQILVPPVPPGTYRIRKLASFRERHVELRTQLRVRMGGRPAAADVSRAAAETRQHCRS